METQGIRTNARNQVIEVGLHACDRARAVLDAAEEARYRPVDRSSLFFHESHHAWSCPAVSKPPTIGEGDHLHEQGNNTKSVRSNLIACLLYMMLRIVGQVWLVWLCIRQL